VAKGRRNPLLEGQEGKDLLLLLDLASHSLGLVPALQVLALLDEGFQRLCQPKLMKFQIMGEERVLQWEPAPLHSWLRRDLACKKLKVTGYLATLGRKRLEVLEEEKGKDGLYMATIGKKEEKEGLALSLLLNGCRMPPLELDSKDELRLSGKLLLESTH